MMKLLSFVLAFLVAVGLPWGYRCEPERAKTSALKTLTEETFEHLTQAASGATTGDWFVMFYAPWCGHCKALHPKWEKLAEDLHQQVNVAQVDATVEKNLGERFKIRGYPTLLLFSKGKYYEYEGPRDPEKMAAFAKGDFRQSAGTEVPVQLSGMKLWLARQASYVKADLNLILRQAKAVGAALILISLVCGGLIGFSLGYMMGSSMTASPHERTRSVSKSRKEN